MEHLTGFDALYVAVGFSLVWLSIACAVCFAGLLAYTYLGYLLGLMRLHIVGYKFREPLGFWQTFVVAGSLFKRDNYHQSVTHNGRKYYVFLFRMGVPVDDEFFGA